MLGNEIFYYTCVIDNATDGFPAFMFIKITYRQPDHFKPHYFSQSGYNFLSDSCKQIGCHSIHQRLYNKNDNQDYNKRSEEHTSELQSRGHLVCRLLLEKKKSHKTSQGYR